MLDCEYILRDFFRRIKGRKRARGRGHRLTRFRLQCLFELAYNKHSSEIAFFHYDCGARLRIGVRIDALVVVRGLRKRHKNGRDAER